MQKATQSAAGARQAQSLQACSTILTGKYASQHGAAATAWHLLRKLEEQGDVFNAFQSVYVFVSMLSDEIKLHESIVHEKFSTRNFRIYSRKVQFSFHTCTPKYHVQSYCDLNT